MDFLLGKYYLHQVDDTALGERIISSLRHADEHREEIAGTIRRHQTIYEHKVYEMSQFFASWLNRHFS